MQLKKSDFIEIEFTAKIKDGEIFDSNVKEHLQKLNPEAKAEPFIYSLGQDMFLKGIDDFLMKQSPEKFPAEFKIELEPENAFGKRDPKQIQMIPMKIFKQHNVQPVPGTSLNFDGKIAKIITVSGGRVLVDFNGPLAGKDVIYEIKILRKLENLNEKIDSFLEFLFKKKMNFEIKDKKLILKVNKGLKQFAEMFKDKFKEIFNLNLEVEEIDENPKSSKPDEQNS